MHTHVKQYNYVAVQPFRPVAIKCLYIVLRIVSSCNLSESSDRYTCKYTYVKMLIRIQPVNRNVPTIE